MERELESVGQLKEIFRVHLGHPTPKTGKAGVS